MSAFHEQLSLIATQFHFLRPYWLMALIPAVLFSIFLWRQKRSAHQWQQLIEPELLPFLLDGKSVKTQRTMIIPLLCAWCIASFALAGPSWIKRPIPVEKNQQALVILLDLSYSMLSEDIKPSRIARARLKIADILRERKDGQTALVVYAGEAHTVTPISDDSATIVSLLSSMLPNIMPLQGSNTEAAVARGIQLLGDAGATRGDLLLITDGVVPEAFDKIKQLIAGQKIHLNILGVGTTQPAPIPAGNGGFLKDRDGTILTTQLNSNELTQLAQSVGGRYHEIASNNSDIDYLKPQGHSLDDDETTLKREFDQWLDHGHWLVFLLLPLALFSFRRGMIFCLLLIPCWGLSPSPAYALGFDDMWLTKNQQAQEELRKGDAQKAAETFEHAEWKAAAQYRAGDYAAAAESYSKIDTAAAHYNRGNALTKSGKLEDALKAYDEALKKDPNFEDANKNRAVVDTLLKQQKDQEKNQQQKDQNNKDKNENKDTKDQQDKSQDSQDQNQQEQSKEQQQKEESDKKQQDQEQQEKNQQGKQESSNASAQGKQSANQQSGASSSAANAARTQQGSSAGQQQSAAAAAQGSSASSTSDSQSQEIVDQSQLSDEQKQAFEQWLRRVPDDPSGLLRNKFKHQYLQNRQKQADGELKRPDNNADQRL